MVFSSSRISSHLLSDEMRTCLGLWIDTLAFHRHSTPLPCTCLDVSHVFLSARPEQDIGCALTCCFSSCFLQAAIGAAVGAASAPAEQVDPGTGGWRGMLKRGDEGAAGDRAVSQSPFPSSPQKGHAVNLLDVVRTWRSPVALSRGLACTLQNGRVPNMAWMLKDSRVQNLLTFH